MSARDDFPRTTTAGLSHVAGLTPTQYEAAMDEIDSLRTENAELELDNGDLLHRAIRAEAERDELLGAIIGWQLAIGDEQLTEQAENRLIELARRGQP